MHKPNSIFQAASQVLSTELTEANEYDDILKSKINAQTLADAVRVLAYDRMSYRTAGWMPGADYREHLNAVGLLSVMSGVTTSKIESDVEKRVAAVNRLFKAEKDKNWAEFHKLDKQAADMYNQIQVQRQIQQSPPKSIKRKQLLSPEAFKKLQADYEKAAEARNALADTADKLTKDWITAQFSKA